MSAPSPPTMLLVDDDEVFRQRLARAMEQRGFEVRTAASADDAVRLAREESPELAVVDLRMPGRSGLELVRDLKDVD
ncbi:MAG TPA: response regulator, partial [Polyangiaceae bacterium]|nr:response regulator [Polyangiaceae bacterium]